jgi:cell wall-associated NlpC family hydrolase
MISGKLLRNIVVGDKTITIDIRDMTPTQLMDKLGFSKEQRDWVELLHTAMSSGQDGDFNTLDPSHSAGSYTALITEAEKHLGKPYVFGASGPNSFDCSGFVSHVINKSGVASVGRQTAQGLYNLCTPVSASEAMPGDLVFFHSTYNAVNRTVTHVGIYVGEVNGRPTMIHAGRPVQYAAFDTAYWKRHFFGFGRLSGPAL